LFPFQAAFERVLFTGTFEMQICAQCPEESEVPSMHLAEAQSVIKAVFS
jgi:hypothetical protein